MKKTYKLKICLLIFSICPGCPIIGFSQKSPEKDPVEVIILHTNDMHSQIDHFGKLAYLADSLRKTHPYLFLVSAGDNFTGNPVVDMVADKGYPMIDLMNRCGYSVSAIGNHEFDMGQILLNRKMKQANFPFICCNLDAYNAPLKQPKPFVVLKAGNEITISLLGVLQLGENGLPDSHPSRLNGIQFSDGIAKAKTYRRLKQKYGILIALSHLGIEDDVRLAEAMPELDLIIGGHSHSIIDTPMVVNGVMITQAGSGLRYFGKATLLIKEGNVIKLTDELISAASVTGTNAEVEALIRKYNDNPEFKRIAGIATESVTGKGELGSLMTDAVTSQLQVDFAFQNHGGIRIRAIPKGEITLNDIYRMDPFGNQIVLFMMNREELISLICNSYNVYHKIDLEVSGMTYRVLTDSTGACLNVELKTANGNSLDPDRDYSVGMNSYMAAAYRFQHRDPGIATSMTTAEALINYLETVKEVNYKGVKRAFGTGE